MLCKSDKPSIIIIIIISNNKRYASTLPHAFAYGGAAQLEVGYLLTSRWSLSWPSAVHCNPCTTHCSPGNAVLYCPHPNSSNLDEPPPPSKLVSKSISIIKTTVGGRLPHGDCFLATGPRRPVKFGSPHSVRMLWRLCLESHSPPAPHTLRPLQSSSASSLCPSRSPCSQDPGSRVTLAMFPGSRIMSHAHHVPRIQDHESRSPYSQDHESRSPCSQDHESRSPCSQDPGQVTPWIQDHASHSPRIQDQDQEYMSHSPQVHSHESQS